MVTLQLEESVCIVGSQWGLVQVWDIQSSFPRQLLTINTADIDTGSPQNDLPRYNAAMYYRKPYLYVAGHRISVFCPKHADCDDTRQLWDYPPGEIEPQLIYADFRPEEDVTVGDPGFCLLVPQPGTTIILALFPDKRLVMIPESSLMAGRNTQIYQSKKPLPSKTFRCMAATAGYVAIGTEAVTNPDHRQPRAEAEVHVLHEDGEAIVTFEDHFGDVNCLAMDPCFLVSVSDDHSVVMRDYRPERIFT